MEDRLNEFLELLRRYDEANGIDPVPDKVKKACIISNTPEPLKTHLQLNVGKLGNFNALRVATDDYLRSRRIFKTTSARNTHVEDSMEVDAVSWKGKDKEKSGKGKKGKESHSSKGYGETTTEHSRFEGECRNSGKHGHKASDCWYKQPPKPQGESKSTGKSKCKVTEVSESDSSKQVEETWTSNTSTPQPSLSQVKTIGCPDEGLWIFSLEDSKKRRYTVNWEDQSSNQNEEHELMIDSGCFGHVCPPWFAPQFPMVSSSRVCRSSTRTHTRTRTMLPDTNRDEHWHTAFSNFTCHSIWICSLKTHSATRQQNPHSNMCSELHMYHLCACLVNLYSR